MTYIILDTETGGVNSKTDPLLQISAITIEPDIQIRKWKEVSYLSVYVNPFIGDAHATVAWSIEAETIHGLDKEFLRENGVDEKVALRNLLDFVSPYRQRSGRWPTLIGWNIDFDARFIRAAFSKYSDLPDFPFYWRMLDISELWKWSNLLDHGSENFGGMEQASLELLGSKVKHDALEDCRTTLELANRFEGKFVTL